MLLTAASGLLGIERDSSMSLLQCYTNGRFDSSKFIQLRRNEREQEFDDAAEFWVNSVALVKIVGCGW